MNPFNDNFTASQNGPANVLNLNAHSWPLNIEFDFISIDSEGIIRDVKYRNGIYYLTNTIYVNQNYLFKFISTKTLMILDL